MSVQCKRGDGDSYVHISESTTSGDVTLYPLKKIRWDYHPPASITSQHRGKHVYIVLQNSNGPCPLLSIINTLVLRGEISLLEGGNECDELYTTSVIMKKKLSEMVCTKAATLSLPCDAAIDAAGCDIETFPVDDVTGRPSLQSILRSPLHFRRECQALLLHKESVIASLESGMCVSPSFIDIDAFEYTAANMLIFSLLGVPLYHAWCIALDDVQYGELSVKTFDALLELQVHDLTNSDNVDDREGTRSLSSLARGFLQANAGQVTGYGLHQLAKNMPNGEVAVFFCNNHFSTITKQGDSTLYRLVTDIGFTNTAVHTDVVWERLDRVEESVLCTWDFTEHSQQVSDPFALGTMEEYEVMIQDILEQFPDASHDDLMIAASTIVSCGERPTTQTIIDTWLKNINPARAPPYMRTEAEDRKRARSDTVKGSNASKVSPQLQVSSTGLPPRTAKVPSPLPNPSSMNVQQQFVAAQLIRLGYPYYAAVGAALTCPTLDNAIEYLVGQS